LGDLVNAIVNITQKVPEITEQDNLEPLNLLDMSRVHELVEAIPSDPPVISQSQYFSLISKFFEYENLVDALANFVRSFKELFTNECIILGEVMIQPFTKRQAEEAVNVLEYVWKPVHEMLEYILKESDNEMHIQQILQNIQDLVNMTGSISLSTGLQNIIFTLCSWGFPDNLKDLKSRCKFISICKIILNIAQSNNRVLDKKSWIFLLGYLQQVYERIYGTEEVKKTQMSMIEQKVSENYVKHVKGNRHSKVIKGENASNAMLMAFPSKEENSVVEEVPVIKKKEVKSPTHITADANINFYKINIMLAKQREIDMALPNEIIYKQSKDDGFQEEIDFIKNSLELLITLSYTFDVSYT